MKECCGSKRKTAFCSECGKKLADDPRMELLRFVRGTANGNKLKKEKQLARWARLKCEDKEAECAKRGLALEEKYNRWIEFLERAK